MVRSSFPLGVWGGLVNTGTGSVRCPCTGPCTCSPPGSPNARGSNPCGDSGGRPTATNKNKGKVHMQAQIKNKGKVHMQAQNKNTGKVHMQAQNKNKGKVHMQAQNKNKGKVHMQAPPCIHSGTEGTPRAQAP
eukprot:scaffold21801_cov16-Tisochrysis_lutea.AAC.1